MTDYNIVHVEEGRFELQREEQTLGYLDYHEANGIFFLDYVYVLPQYRGKEVGADIVKEGVKLALSKNLNPKPICGYAGAVMRRHNWPQNYEE